MSNTSKLIDNSLPDYNPANSLGARERIMLIIINGPQERLDYPTEILKMSNGCEVEKYIIPEEDKEKVLNALYPFNDTPALDDERLDIHNNRTFKVRDYIVVREGDGNFLVSPYYAEAGGTVLDWIKPEKDDDAKELKDNPIISIGTIRN